MGFGNAMQSIATDGLAHARLLVSDMVPVLGIILGLVGLAAVIGIFRRFLP